MNKFYYAFQKHANSEIQKLTDFCVFAAVNHLSGPLRTGTEDYLNEFKRSWFVDFDPFCVFLCFKVCCL